MMQFTKSGTRITALLQTAANKGTNAVNYEGFYMSKKFRKNNSDAQKEIRD